MAGQAAITLKLSEMPELVFLLRQEMAGLLLAEAAETDNPDLERSLVEIAAVFEAGQGSKL